MTVRIMMRKNIPIRSPQNVANISSTYNELYLVGIISMFIAINMTDTGIVMIQILGIVSISTRLLPWS